MPKPGRPREFAIRFSGATDGSATVSFEARSAADAAEIMAKLQYIKTHLMSS